MQVSSGTQVACSTSPTPASAAAAACSKLSYAQMVAKSREAAENAEAEKMEKEEVMANGPSSANGPTNGPNGSNGPKSTALRDQSQHSGRPAGQKSNPEFARKDFRSDGPTGSNGPNARRAKENRDRRPPLTGERFRRRESDRDESRPTYASATK